MGLVYKVPDGHAYMHNRRVINQSRDNGVGFDGLPYSAHDTHSDISSALIDTMSDRMRSFESNVHFSIYEFMNLVILCKLVFLRMSPV